MQTKIFLVLSVIASFVFASCSKNDDKSVTVTKTYNMYLGLGYASKVGTDAPSITSLETTVASAVSAINSGFTQITVTGKGETDEAALADADLKAVSIFDERAEAVYVECLNIKNNFESARNSLAGSIINETGYYTKLTMALYLRESSDSSFEVRVVKESEKYYMEAIGGQDYSGNL